MKIDRERKIMKHMKIAAGLEMLFMVG